MTDDPRADRGRRGERAADPGWTQELGQRCRAARRDAIGLATPHGIRVDGALGLAHVARGAGFLRPKGRMVEVNVPVDRALTATVTATAREQGIPVAMAGFGGNDPCESAVPLDWGTMVPLWFLGPGRKMPGYGEHDAAALLDAAVVEAVRANDLGRPLDLDEALARAAAIDGLWQALILAGALGRTSFRTELLGYEAPPVYATEVVVASWTPTRRRHAPLADRVSCSQR